MSALGPGTLWPSTCFPPFSCRLTISSEGSMSHTATLSILPCSGSGWSTRRRMRVSTGCQSGWGCRHLSVAGCTPPVCEVPHTPIMPSPHRGHTTISWCLIRQLTGQPRYADPYPQVCTRRIHPWLRWPQHNRALSPREGSQPTPESRRRDGIHGTTDNSS